MQNNNIILSGLLPADDNTVERTSLILEQRIKKKASEEDLGQQGKFADLLRIEEGVR